MAQIERVALTCRWRRVNRVMIPAANSGKKRTVQTRKSGRMLILHPGEVFDMGGLALAIEGDDERKPDRHFGGGDGHDEEYEDLSIEVVVEAGAGDQGEIGRIQHDFERHVDDEQVATQDDA